MTKVRIRAGRGKGFIWVDSDTAKWSGADFKKIQAVRKEASKDKYVTTGRGTGKIKFGDIKDTAITSTKGKWVSSGRGTGRRKL